MQSLVEGVPLQGGTANYGRVIRYGDTVQRPRGPHTPAVHALLRHLEQSGFAGAPRIQQPDAGAESSVEILGYIEGSAATSPLADWALTDAALTSVGVLLRELHNHAEGFDGSQARWQWDVPRRWRGDLVTHNDVNPANVIFRGGRAVALIDFDLAAPASRAWDLAVTACFWVPLRADHDVEDSRLGRRPSRYGILLDAYGADADLRRDVAEALVPGHRWIASIIRDRARQGHPAFRRMWEREHDVHERAHRWLSEHTHELRSASGVHPREGVDGP